MVSWGANENEIDISDKGAWVLPYQPMPLILCSQPTLDCSLSDQNCDDLSESFTYSDYAERTPSNQPLSSANQALTPQDSYLLHKRYKLSSYTRYWTSFHELTILLLALRFFSYLSWTAMRSSDTYPLRCPSYNHPVIKGLFYTSLDLYNAFIYFCSLLSLRPTHLSRYWV